MYDFTSNGFPQIFSGIIGNAAMTLPALTSKNDEEFLLAMSGKVMNAFWMEYMGALPYEIQNELLLALHANDQEAIFNWYTGYADFPGDENARALATIILDELTEALPELIKEEYDSFNAVSSVAV